MSYQSIPIYCSNANTNQFPSQYLNPVFCLLSRASIHEECSVGSDDPVEKYTTSQWREKEREGARGRKEGGMGRREGEGEIDGWIGEQSKWGKNGKQRKERDERRGRRKKREVGKESEGRRGEGPEGKEKEMREEGVGMEVGIYTCIDYKPRDTLHLSNDIALPI